MLVPNLNSKIHSIRFALIMYGFI